MIAVSSVEFIMKGGALERTCSDSPIGGWGFFCFVCLFCLGVGVFFVIFWGGVLFRWIFFSFTKGLNF